MKFSEETLMAYADDELDDATRAAIEAQMRTDPQTAQEVARHQALRAKLRGAFGGVLVESVPERLIAAAHTAPAVNGATVVSLSAARDARSGVTSGATMRRWSAPHWFAIAATLVIGVIGTRLALMSDSGPIVADNGRMIASGALAAALSTQVGAGHDAAPLQIGISFLAKSGDYCRTFNVGDKERLAGLACREGDQWRVKALAQADRQGDGFRMAASALPPAILRAVEDSISGEALDAAGEAMARQRDWKQQ
jgi:hypothetical protein